jgi:hypothetical protein
MKSAHLPVGPTIHWNDQDLDAVKAAFISRFDETLPRTETLFAAAHIGYRMALRDMAAGKRVVDEPEDFGKPDL